MGNQSIYTKPKTAFLTEEEYNDRSFINVKSNCSCWIKDIKGILYGGFQSRFWILRKHFNVLSLEDLRDLPFYNWQCI